MILLDEKYKKILRWYAKELKEFLSHNNHDPRLQLKPLDLQRSFSFGWYTPIAKISRAKGTFELWIDKCPNIDRPVLSICYSAQNMDYIKKISKIYSEIYGKKCSSPRAIKIWENDHVTYEKPLPYNMFNKPIQEDFDKYFFFTIYFSEKISSKKNLMQSVNKMSLIILSSMSNSFIDETSDGKEIENRKKIEIHIRRERSKKLAALVKNRDGYKCKICGFDFLEQYGEIGRGFAEAHHIVPLSKLDKKVHSDIKSLITVCANCHRMLHKMGCASTDIKKLKAAVRSKY